MTKAVMVDCETTGLDEPEVIQLAFSRSFAWGEEPTAEDYSVLLFKPSKPITPGAKAAHHIIEADLETHSAWPGKFYFPVEYMIGHNVDFDWKALGSQPGVKRICTLALATALYEDTDSHSLTALMYYLFEAEDARKLARTAHSAHADVQMTWLLLKELMRDSGRTLSSLEDLWRLSEDARIPRRLSFGKHGPQDGRPGLLYSEVPTDYLDWMVKQQMEPYVLEAARRELRARVR
jgi:exodeoxyribonuclease X